MNGKKIALAIVATISILSVNDLRAQEGRAGRSPFMLSLISPAQFPPPDYDIGGLKLNLIYGESRDLIGLDLGLFSQNMGDARSLHINGVSVINGNGVGLMISLANYVEGEYKGLQIGAYNHATHLDGLQIGLINYSNTAYGLQIGVVNVIEDNDAPFIPIINAYF